MEQYHIRKAAITDIADIMRIYNSNTSFLANHLGLLTINSDFIRGEMTNMEAAGFLSCVITGIQSTKVIGAIDYKPDETVYLSLIILDAASHGNGIGTAVYQSFENLMRQKGKQAIRIDVVNDYRGNVVEFWEKQGFLAQDEVEIDWGNKRSKALVMVKSLL